MLYVNRIGRAVVHTCVECCFQVNMSHVVLRSVPLETFQRGYLNFVQCPGFCFYIRGSRFINSSSLLL